MPIFVEYGKDSRFLIKILVIIVCVFAVVIVMLGINLVRHNVLYINPSNVIGTARIGYVPEDAVMYFASAFVYLRGNASPLTVNRQYVSVYTLMSPALQSSELNTLKKEVAEISNSNIVIQTIPNKVNISTSGEDSFIANVEAIRTSYVYGKETSKKLVNYTLYIQRAKIKKDNPFGLEVTSYDYKVIQDIVDNTATNQ